MLATDYSQTCPDARFYPTPKQGAEQVAQRVAFYVGKQGLRVGEPPLDAPKI